MKEQANKVVSGSLKYTGRMLVNMVNIVLFIIGGTLILLPAFLMGGYYYPVLGVALILTAILRILFKRHDILIRNSYKAAYGFVLIFQITMFVLEMFPTAVMIPSTAGPHEVITKTASYFDLVNPFGAGEFAPILTGILTVTIIALSTMVLIMKKAKSNLKNAAFICSIFAFIFSILPPFRWGIAYTSVINYAISVLILVCILLQTVANRQRNG